MKSIWRTVYQCCILSLFAATPSLAAMLIGQNLLWFPHNEGWGENTDIFAPGVNLASATNPFKPEAISELQPFSVIRFMDGSMINRNWDSTWMNRRAKGDNTQNCSWGDGNNGIAYEWQIELCNRTGRDYWLNIPLKSLKVSEMKGIPDYPLRLAILIRHGVDMKKVNLTTMMDSLSTVTAADLIAAGGVRTCAGLNPALHVYIEYANETWLFTWDYVNAKGKALDPSFGAPEFHATACLRSAAAFYKVFGANSPLIRPVFAGQWGNPWHCQQQVKMAANATYNPEKIKPYGIAMAPYFDNSSLPGITNGTDANTIAHRRTATSAGIKLLCYEGGVQGNGTAGTSNTGRPDLYNQYMSFLAGMEKMGVDEFVHYGYQGAAGWGSKESIGQPLAEAHKYRALLEVANKNNPSPTSVHQRAQRAVTVQSGAAATVGRVVVDIRGRAAALSTAQHAPGVVVATGAAGYRALLARVAAAHKR